MFENGVDYNHSTVHNTRQRLSTLSNFHKEGAVINYVITPFELTYKLVDVKHRVQL